MVFVNDKKYACETCIKGHRSSTCNHTERPLFEIKKKGRPITQCEHCRELRKTKQVHVKCVCEGREDPSTVSHSIPAKKANRKGPPPSAAFPFGLQSLSTPASDSEEASNVLNKAKASQKASSGSCSCKKNIGLCNCCTPRHAPRSKRSVTPPMPRPKVGDIRATTRRPSSDPGDAQELSQRLLPAEPDVHALTRAHGSRMTHGSALYNPYGHAHDAHLRSHDVRNGHEATSMRGMDASNGYIYPVPPISFDQQQNFGAPSEASSAWPNSERLSEDVSTTMPSSYDQQSSEYQPDPFGAVNFGSVDVDAWLREMMASNNNSSTDSDVSTSQQSSSSMTYTDSRTDSQALPVPRALDVSHDLARAQDPDFAQASSQFDLLPRLGIDFNDNYLGVEHNTGGNMNDVRPTVGVFDTDVFRYTARDAMQEVRESAPETINSVSNPFSASMPHAMLNMQGGNGDFQFTSMTLAEPKPQQYAFDYLFDGDYVIRPSPGLPPLTRSSSIGSHSSGRSRSSMGMNQWQRNGSSDCVNSTTAVSNQWQNTADNTGLNGLMTGVENTWSVPSFPSISETANDWHMSRVQALMQERGRAPAGAAVDVPATKDSAAPTDMQSLSFN